MDSHVENLNHRLRGLCDNVDAGQEKFQEKEMVFSIRGTSTVPLTLRVRHSIDPNSRIPWQLRWANFYVWAKVELGPDQICGSTWDESEEHSCEKLLWHRLQQQCRRVSHWTRLQVVNKCLLWRGCVLIIHSISDLSTSTLPRGTSLGRDESRSLWAGYVWSCKLQFGYFHHRRSIRLVTILQIWTTSSL